MIKSHKLRIFPTPEQEQKMWQHIGSTRYVWNWMLAKQQALYEQGEKHLSAFSMIKLLTQLKNDGEHGWLYEVSNSSLKIACQDLEKAYQAFFKKQGGFPKFKSRKRSKPSFPVRSESFYFKDEKFLNLEKIGKVKYKTDFTLPIGRGDKFSNPRVSNTNGKWMLSFGIAFENQEQVLTDKAMGVDLGVKDTIIAAYGNEKIVFPNINKGKQVRNLKRKIRHTQRSISRKYEANRQGNKFVKTNNIEREERKLNKLYARLSGIRNNYTHQCTHKLVSKLPCKVVMEDLNVQGMMKNKHLSGAIQEQGFHEIIRQMQYKCEWNGIPFLQAGRFYPSSKTCSSCGHIHRNLRLSDRTFTCPECGFTIDRDYQAALNLSRYAA